MFAHAKLLLAPLAAIFGFGVWCKKRLYKWGILRTFRPSVKTIGIGNLSMGGTGKTPMSKYVMQLLMLSGYRLAYVSRGYGRATKGLMEVTLDHSSSEVGDESLEVKHDLPSAHVVVSEKRAKALEKIQKAKSAEIAVLDDVYQHLSVKPGFLILLTSWQKPYYKDWLFPAGFLREPTSAKKRADVLVVTKCPDSLNRHQADEMRKKLAFKGKVFFAGLQYSKVLEPVLHGKNMGWDIIDEKKVALITGIAQPKPLIEKVAMHSTVDQHFQYADHHAFQEKDFAKWCLWHDNQKGILLTTSKDAMRIRTHPARHMLNELPLFYCAVEQKMLLNQTTEFQNVIKQYVEEN